MTSRLLEEVRNASRKYEWGTAADFCQQRLESLGLENSSLEAANVAELMSKCYFKAAFQSKTHEEFKWKMELARAASEKATTVFARSGSQAFSNKSEARAEFASFWLAEGWDERRTIVKNCIELAEEAARGFEAEGDRASLAQSWLDLITYSIELNNFTIDWRAQVDLLKKAVAIGKKATALFENLGDMESLAHSMYATLYFQSEARWIFEPGEFKEAFPEVLKEAKKLRVVSEKLGTSESLGLLAEIQASIAIGEGDHRKMMEVLSIGIESAQPTMDAYLLGRLNLLFVVGSRSVATEGEEGGVMREALDKGINRGWKAVESFKIIGHSPSLYGAYDFLADCYVSLGYSVETDVDQKISQFRKAAEVARNELGLVPVSDASHALAKALYFLATLEPNSLEKQHLLTEALRHREATVHLFDITTSPRAWDRGVQFNYLALTKAELSKTERDQKVKIDLLKSAISDMELCMDVCKNWEGPFYANALSEYNEWYGDILVQMFHLTAERRSAERAVEAYEETITHRSRANMGGPTGPVRWKIAKLYDSLGDYGRASTTFRKAAEDYRISAKKTQGLASFFNELGSYLNAWSLIDDARLHHSEENFSKAAQDYTEAAEMLRSTSYWNHLSRLYDACSLFESGEALSREEKQNAAIESFNAALKAFREARAEIEKKLTVAKGEEEKSDLNNWSAIARIRERLSLGRMELEEAKSLDKRGEEEASSIKYRSAADVFRALQSQAENEQGRRELETQTLFCEAWARMRDAESKASPELYAQAADSFARIENVATRKRFRLLSLANASMCRALGSGSLFRRTRDTRLYSEIKQQLETAGDYYQEGGFQSEARWTQATQRLFDALVYLADAESEKDRAKKTELFHLAEKHLERASALYGEAGFPSKKEEALRHLQRAKGEKELLLTPIEALRENPALTSAAVAPVTFSTDQATGLEKFEGANVVGNMTIQQSNLSVGSDVTLELEMANVGKTSATLVKLENIVPEGLELDKEKISQRVEDNHIDMRGRRLDYLKTHEVKVHLKTKRKGAFEVRPRVLFVDEKGNYRSYEFEPIAFRVMELGISGWLKGPR